MPRSLPSGINASRTAKAAVIQHIMKGEVANRMIVRRFRGKHRLKTPEQLGKLAEMLPGASPAKARQLKERIIRGFYGPDYETRMIEIPTQGASCSGPLYVSGSGSLDTLPKLVSRVFPDRRYAATGMKTPCSGLSGRIPARLAKTKDGRAAVKGFLIGVGHGNFQ